MGWPHVGSLYNEDHSILGFVLPPPICGNPQLNLEVESRIFWQATILFYTGSFVGFRVDLGAGIRVCCCTPDCTLKDSRR